MAFANPGFNANGQHQDQLPPTLRYLTFVDQQDAVAQARVNNAWQIEDTFSWFMPGAKGDHNLRLGVQYQHSTADSIAQDTGTAMFVFRTDCSVRRQRSAHVPRAPDHPRARARGARLIESHYFGAFVQDKWKLNSRLTLSLGVRYDLERIPIVEEDNPAFPDPNDYPVDGNNFGPRVGFAYDATATAKTVIRGGYGRFFDKTPLRADLGHRHRRRVLGLVHRELSRRTPPTPGPPGPPPHGPDAGATGRR